MKHIQFPILFTSGFLLIYITLPPFGTPYFIVYIFFILMHIFFFWMVYRILRNGEPSGKKFEDHWYDDEDMPRSR